MNIWRLLGRLLVRFLHRLLLMVRGRRQSAYRRRPKGVAEASSTSTRRGWSSKPKPLWVRQEVLRLKALMPDHGCRKIASTFRYPHASRGETISKSFVARLVRQEAEAVLRLRGDLKIRVPQKVPRNLIWALDLKFIPTPLGGQRAVLGVIDHGSQACLALKEITERRSAVVLRVLLDVVELCGKPRILHTDNESIFTSWLFRFVLWMLRIRHQRTAVRTLAERPDRTAIPDTEATDRVLERGVGPDS